MTIFEKNRVTKITRRQSIFLKRRFEWKRWLPLLFCVVCAGLSLGLTLVARANSAFAERLSQLLYRRAANLLGRITGKLPFSLLEFGLIALIIAVFVLLAVFILKVIKNKGNRQPIIMRWLMATLCVLCAGWLVFTLLCGINYARQPFSHYSGLTVQPSTVAELETLCTALASEANALRPQLTEDANGVAQVFTKGYAPVAEQSRTAMQRLAKRYPVLNGYYPKPKAITFSSVMSRLTITGVYSPFTMEANVNIACPEYGIPATMCHELSHLRGFMREDEANFIAYLACMESDDVAFRYSGITLALSHAEGKLYRADTQRYAALTATYSDGLKRDFAFDLAYWAPYQDALLSRASNKINDTYLKANKQLDGVQSYGRMVDLLLALQRETGGIALPT